MKRTLAVLALILSFASFSFAGDNNSYRFSIDLTKTKDDKLMVTLLTPQLPQGEVIYHIPKIVPGTYEIYDFGRFVHDFKAYDNAGKEIAVQKIDANSWKMDGKTVARLTYWVEDTWDTQDKKDFVFEPAGTNIEDGSNFILNTHGFFGYFEGMKKLTYKLDITKPEGFYGSTGLSDVATKDNTDTYTIPDYMQLVDSPIMYSKPDTTVVKVGDSNVLVSVFSKGGKVSSKFVADNIREILQATSAYLGGLPVKKYAFIFYFYNGMSGSGASGALEHSYSSMYFLPEVNPDYLSQMVKDVTAHEFLHIVTPLNIHSEEIGDFDYIKPSMSRHLWMYEGVTEYSAGLVQVKKGKMKEEQYIDVVRSKMYGAERFNDTLPFTVMSKGCLDTYKEQYGNVYEKGALIGMCLDIKLRDLSNGAYGVQELLRDLAKTYGKDKSFKDEELFGQIVKLTYPQIGEFFKRYVDGKEPLPLKETLALVGYDFEPKGTSREISMGGIKLGLDQDSKRAVVADVSKMTEFGKKMGYQKGDIIDKFNGQDFTVDKIEDIITKFYDTAKEGDKLEVTVLRKNAKGKVKKKKLKGKVEATTTEVKYLIKPAASPTEKQIQTRKAWLGQM